MAAPALIPVSEYLKTSYRPDCDFVDGVVKERNMGESPHAAIQNLFGTVFSNHRKLWGIRALTEQRVQVSGKNYRVADVCVVRLGNPPGPIIAEAPLICIEILSDGQSLLDMRERVDDYVAMGVANIWLFDPIKRRAWTADANGFHELLTNEFAVAETPIRIPLAGMYQELDDLAAGR